MNVSVLKICFHELKLLLILYYFVSFTSLYIYIFKKKTRHNFKLNLHTTYGEAISDNLAGAFGSPNEVDVNELYIIIYSLLEPAISSQHPLACIFQKDSASNGGSTSKCFYFLFFLQIIIVTVHAVAVS